MGLFQKKIESANLARHSWRVGQINPDAVGRSNWWRGSAQLASRAGHHHHDGTVNVTFECVKVVLDVIRLAEFAGPPAGRQLPGGVCGNAVRIGDDGDLLSTRFVRRVGTVGVSERCEGGVECFQR